MFKKLLVFPLLVLLCLSLKTERQLQNNDYKNAPPQNKESRPQENAPPQNKESPPQEQKKKGTLEQVCKKKGGKICKNFLGRPKCCKQKAMSFGFGDRTCGIIRTCHQGELQLKQQDWYV